VLQDGINFVTRWLTLNDTYGTTYISYTSPPSSLPRTPHNHPQLTNNLLLSDPVSLGTYIQPVTWGHTAATYGNICTLSNMLFAHSDAGLTRGLGQLACLVQYDPNPMPAVISPALAASASTCNIQNTLQSNVHLNWYLNSYGYIQTAQ
jgi:hypothetical protein